MLSRTKIKYGTEHFPNPTHFLSFSVVDLLSEDVLSIVTLVLDVCLTAALLFTFATKNVRIYFYLRLIVRRASAHKTGARPLQV